MKMKRINPFLFALLLRLMFTVIFSSNIDYFYDFTLQTKKKYKDLIIENVKEQPFIIYQINNKKRILKL